MAEKAKWRWVCKEPGVTKPEKLPCHAVGNGVPPEPHSRPAVHQFTVGRGKEQSG